MIMNEKEQAIESEERPAISPETRRAWFDEHEVGIGHAGFVRDRWWISLVLVFVAGVVFGVSL